MNSETGQIKRLSDLTEEEKKSGKWKEIYGLQEVKLVQVNSKSDLKREQIHARSYEKEKRRYLCLKNNTQV